MKDKRQRFEEVAGKRVRFIIDKLDLLGNCSNRNNYEYNEEDTKKMFGAIKEAIRLTELRFQNELSKSKKNKFKF
ncbi:hypothetical protein [Salinimicrobium sediminilitoris]|uniref:hypothetical protein n=1 Tax=Salinimicrobium sediminilitoris TaxID=2876715 RepID=UPI001E3C29BE|nr:hypothetical protein [Salinimicrobium sediminilitoris]MCC8361017.1 hypothetical protein [Salinimicrobium sediminilitoris]